MSDFDLLEDATSVIQPQTIVFNQDYTRVGVGHTGGAVFYALSHPNDRDAALSSAVGTPTARDLRGSESCVPAPAPAKVAFVLEPPLPGAASAPESSRFVSEFLSSCNETGASRERSKGGSHALPADAPQEQTPCKSSPAWASCSREQSTGVRRGTDGSEASQVEDGELEKEAMVGEKELVVIAEKAPAGVQKPELPAHERAETVVPVALAQASGDAPAVEDPPAAARAAEQEPLENVDAEDRERGPVQVRSGQRPRAMSGHSAALPLDDELETSSAWLSRAGNGIAVMALLYQTHYVAATGGGPYPLGGPNTVFVFGDNSALIAQIVVPHAVQRLAFDHEMLLVVTSAQLRLYSLAHVDQCRFVYDLIVDYIQEAMPSCSGAPPWHSTSDLSGSLRWEDPPVVSQRGDVPFTCDYPSHCVAVATTTRRPAAAGARRLSRTSVDSHGFILMRYENNLGTQRDVKGKVLACVRSAHSHAVDQVALVAARNAKKVTVATCSERGTIVRLWFYTEPQWWGEPGLPAAVPVTLSCYLELRNSSVPARISSLQFLGRDHIAILSSGKVKVFRADQLSHVQAHDISEREKLEERERAENKSSALQALRPFVAYLGSAWAICEASLPKDATFTPAWVFASPDALKALGTESAGAATEEPGTVEPKTVSVNGRGGCDVEGVGATVAHPPQVHSSNSNLWLYGALKQIPWGAWNLAKSAMVSHTEGSGESASGAGSSQWPNHTFDRSRAGMVVALQKAKEASAVIRTFMTGDADLPRNRSPRLEDALVMYWERAAGGAKGGPRRSLDVREALAVEWAADRRDGGTKRGDTAGEAEETLKHFCIVTCDGAVVRYRFYPKRGTLICSAVSPLAADE